MQHTENGDRFAFDAIHQDVVGMRYCLTGVRHPTGAIQVGVGFDTVGVSLEILVKRQRCQGFVAGDEVPRCARDPTSPADAR